MKWGAAAACLAVAFATAFSVLPLFNLQGGTSADAPQRDPAPAATEIHINMGDVSVNDIASFRGHDIWYDPVLYDKVVWNEAAVIDYYGKALTPAYIPDGLISAPGNGAATVIIDKDGNVKEDTVWLGFYHGYYLDGSQKLTEDAAACKGFSMRISKVGLRNNCFYILPENEVKASDIGGTNVIFGHLSMPYGPIRPRNAEALRLL